MGLRAGIQTALEIVYPSRCMCCAEMVSSSFGLCGPCWRDTPFVGGSICDGCGAPLPGETARGEALQCDSCLRFPRDWDRGRAALLYEGRARQLVMRFKHGDRQEIAHPAGQWMCAAGRDLLADATAILVPIPLHWTRLVKRRYNQSAMLAHQIAQRTGLAYLPDGLIRTQRTPLLRGKSFAERQDILKGAITTKPKRCHKLAGRRVILVDDVLTSGATLSEATQACRAAGALHVDVLVLARVIKDPYMQREQKE